jgi:hypothetical protein
MDHDPDFIRLPYHGWDAIRAIEVKAMRWIDQRETSAKTGNDEPRLLP